ncbi:hypothetical protein D210916BOD24_20290 [Alteromonas sp. D210916BOD_24]|uniref:hypothetical protein n=1 Tax=Alteromonas sp. D210916BOD_24 TaxID=3157618 RepID=UPI00399CC7C8
MEKIYGIHNIYLAGRKHGRRFMAKRSIGAVRLWRSLTFAQRCYLVATSMLLVWFYFDINSTIFDVVMYSFVLAGLTNEVWPRFMLVWHSLPGKAAILFIYAVIANFALASASGMVNDVVGVSANALPYSHNFALILMMPTWFFLTSIIALVVVTLLTPLYLLALLVLKPIGVRRFWHAPDYRFVFTTALVRYIWTLALLFELILLAAQAGLMGAYNNGVSEDIVSVTYEKEASTPIPSSSSVQVEGSDSLTEDDAGVDTPTTSVKTVIDDINKDQPDIEEDVLLLWEEAKAKNKAFKRSQRRLLAEFIYEFESDSRSRCAHSDDSRVIELNDYEILQITRTQSEDNEIGYQYEVLACRSPGIGNTQTAVK